MNNGVVLLSGDAKTISDHLRAIEDARAVQGVQRVASEIQSPDKLSDAELWYGDDKRGVLAWDMTLGPDEERVIEFGYRTTWPAAKKVTYGQGS